MGDMVCNWHDIGLVEGDIGWSCPMCPNPNNLNREIERLSAEVADLKRGINWHAECLNCAKLMDDNYGQYVEIERLRHRVDRLNAALDDIEHLCDERQVLHRIKEARRG